MPITKLYTPRACDTMKAIAKVEESLMENADIRIGTCGFSYAEWREVFYPKDLRQSEFLRFYSLVFPFVELDFSWYAMPKAEQLLAMTEQTPPDFLFCLKAHRSLSHEIGKDWGESAERFSSAAQVLSDKRQLAAILIQLPFRFSYTAENRVYLGDLISALDGFPLVVEFRNEFWYQQRVFDELAKREVCLAIIDRPELPGLPPESQVLTSDRVYYRLHGRNSTQWWNGDASSRYDYEYSPEELKDRARMLAAISRKAKQVLVAFNNHADAKAVKNARSLEGYIREFQL